MITIVNYGLGNVQAFANIYKRLNIDVCIAENASVLREATRIILPGVGSFDWAMLRLEASGMRKCLDQLVMHEGVPVLGICVGMQMMALSSEEGKLAGLGWIDARVKRFDESHCSGRTHLPHMGWNDVEPVNGDCLFRGMSAPRYYFLHSYFFDPANQDVVLARTKYYDEFASCVRQRNVFGAQFHPEKSHQWGIQLLRNFAELE